MGHAEGDQPNVYQRRRREVWTRLDRSSSLLRSLSRPLSPCIKPSEFVFVFCIWKSFTHQRGKVDHTLQILEIILDSPELRNLSVFHYILSWPDKLLPPELGQTNPRPKANEVPHWVSKRYYSLSCFSQHIFTPLFPPIIIYPPIYPYPPPSPYCSLCP